MGLPKLFFDNRFADAIPVATSTAFGDYAAANVADMRPYTWWKANALPASLTVDCGSAKAADFALVYGHDLYTQGAMVEVRGSTDNFSASNVLVASYTPSSNNPFLKEFTSASYRYWRITITGAAGNKPAIAIAMIGKAFVIPHGLSDGVDPLWRKENGTSNSNDNGHPLGKIIDFEQYKQSLAFKNLPWDWLRSDWLPAWRTHLRGSPFVYAWDSIRYPDEMYLLTTTGGFSAPHNRGKLAKLTVSVVGVAT